MLRMRFASVFLAGLALSLAGAFEPSLGSEATNPINQLSGRWVIGDDLSAKRCDVDLLTAKEDNGFRLIFAKACGPAFPILRRVRSWRPDAFGGIELVGESGDVVVAYGVSESDALMSFAPDNVFLSLTKDTDRSVITAAIPAEDVSAAE